MYRLTLLILAFFSPATLAFSPSLSASSRSAAKYLPPLKSQTSEMTESLEKAAVGRFTVGYNKLCKNCPTRLRPRQDTLVEMIVGLPAEEREELLVAVQRRLEEAATNENAQEGLRTPMEVYKFQLEGEVAPSTIKNGVSKKRVKVKRNGTVNGEEKKKDAATLGEKELKEVERKMEKAREKLGKSEIKLARAIHLLEVTTTLLQNGASALPDEEDDEEIDELRSMPRQYLKLQHLKYLAVKTKCERTRAKCRVKRYAASLDLARIKAKLHEQVG